MDATFLLSSLQSPERFELLASLSSRWLDGGGVVAWHVTGDALHAWDDARYRPSIDALIQGRGVRFSLDATEARMRGVHAAGTIPDFWQALVRNVVVDAGFAKAGFLQLLGPYYSRTTVYATRFARACIDAGVTPGMYLYIDGIHLSHAGQAPSEFENAGDGIAAIVKGAAASGLSPHVLACSRCATARGYATPVFDDEHARSGHAIPEVAFVNLNTIVENFVSPAPVLSADAFTTRAGPRGTGTASKGDDAVPALWLFVTTPPYGNEHAFGAVSLAIAAAVNHDIPTTLCFIEDGVHCLARPHDVQPADKVFNLPEVLVATADEARLSCVASTRSLATLGVNVQPALDFIDVLEPEHIAGRVARDGGAAGSRGLFF